MQTCDYLPQSGLLGGHSGIGPPGVGTLGIAAYANVPTRPTNRSNALSERFIGFAFSLGSAEGWRKTAEHSARELYTTMQHSDSLEVTSRERNEYTKMREVTKINPTVPRPILAGFMLIP